MWTLLLFAAGFILNSMGANVLEIEDDSGACPEGWINAQSLGCFKFLDDAGHVNWMDAHSLCEIEGGFLAEPSTHELMDLLSLLASLEQNFTAISFWWIGLSDFSHEGSWIWSHTSQGATEMFWGEGRPYTGNANNADCVLMEFRDDTLKWTDVDCQMVSYLGHAVAPVCQLEIGTTTPSFTTARPTTTTNSWQSTTTYPRQTTTTNSWQSTTTWPRTTTTNWPRTTTTRPRTTTTNWPITTTTTTTRPRTTTRQLEK